MENNKPNLSLYCLKYGQSSLPESMVFVGGDKEKTIPISFCIYLIRLGERNILVDAGCDTMPGFVMKNFYSPAQVLEDIGIFAKEITDVIITHSHHDHIEALKHFTNATVHISDEQYNNGKKYIADNMPVNIVKDTYFFSDHIKMVKWGGHAVGSAIVEIRNDDIIHILAGDECYTNENIRQKICTGSFVCKEKAVEFVEKFSNMSFVVHTCHDSSLKTERII